MDADRFPPVFKQLNRVNITATVEDIIQIDTDSLMPYMYASLPRSSPRLISSSGLLFTHTAHPKKPFTHTAHPKEPGLAPPRRYASHQRERNEEQIAGQLR